MRRILAIHCPSVRRTPGSSFGPMKMRATMPITTSSAQLKSNMEMPTPRASSDYRTAHLSIPIAAQPEIEGAPESPAPSRSAPQTDGTIDMHSGGRALELFFVLGAPLQI